MIVLMCSPRVFACFLLEPDIELLLVESEAGLEGSVSLFSIFPEVLVGGPYGKWESWI